MSEQLTEEPTAVARDMLIRGVRVRFLEVGQGPPLLLLHGFLVDHRCWSLVLPKLSKHFRVIAPDLPGFGDSERPRDYAYSREAFAETVRDLLAGLEIPRAHVCGHSLGGSIALVLAADHPECVDRLALINTASYAFEAPLKARLPLIPVFGEFLFKQLYRKTLFHDYFKRNVFAPGFAYDRAMVDAYYRSFSPAESREATYRTLQKTLELSSLEPKISRVRARTLLVWGELDPMFPMHFATRLAREIEGSRLETLAGCGHAPPEERPERTAELLLKHFGAGDS